MLQKIQTKKDFNTPAAGAAPPDPPAAAGAATAPPAGTEANLERPVREIVFFSKISNPKICYASLVRRPLPEFMTSLMSFPLSSPMTCREITIKFCSRKNFYVFNIITIITCITLFKRSSSASIPTLPKMVLMSFAEGLAFPPSAAKR